MRSKTWLVAVIILVTFTLNLSFNHTAYADSVYVANTLNDLIDINIGDGNCATSAGTCSLRAAVQEANANADATQIYLLPGTYKFKINGADENAAETGDLDISSEVAIIADSIGSVTIDARFKDRIFDVRTDGNLTLWGVTLTNGSTNGQGGAVSAEALESQLTLDNVTITNSYSSTAGGAVSAVTSNFISNFSTFTGNDAPQGGAIYAYEATVSVSYNTFRDNAALLGGAAALLGSTTSVMGSEFDANNAICLTGITPCASADLYGGALYVQSGDADVSMSTFSGNTSGGVGGAIGAYESDTSIWNVEIRGNTARTEGGGIYAYDSVLDIEYVSIVRNASKKGSGGGLALVGTNGTISDTTISSNRAKLGGGGLYIPTSILPDSEVELVHVTLAYNSSSSGTGGLENETETELIARGSIISDNTAGQCSGHLLAYDTQISSTDGCTLTLSSTNVYTGSANLLPLSYGVQGFTLAHAPAVNSPVLDKEVDCTSSFDQYEYFRPADDCTLGAVDDEQRNLLVNESFESGISGWVRNSPDGKDKVVFTNPYSGSNAFLFKGKSGKTSSISQTVKGAVLSGIGDDYDFCASGMFYTGNSNGKNVRLLLKVQYTGGAKEKSPVDVSFWEGEYELSCSGIITVDLQGGTRSVKKVSLSITSTSTSGTVYVDGLSLTLYTPLGTRRDGAASSTRGAAAGVLPVPPLPDGFRGGN